jgi:hypothetical protein
MTSTNMENGGPLTFMVKYLIRSVYSLNPPSSRGISRSRNHGFSNAKYKQKRNKTAHLHYFRFLYFSTIGAAEEGTLAML